MPEPILQLPSNELPGSKPSGPAIRPCDPNPREAVVGWREELERVLVAIRTAASKQDTQAALEEVTAIHEKLKECSSLAEEQIESLNRQLDALEPITPDTDPVRVIRGVKGKRLPDEDVPLTTDPDDYPLY
jgi:hypothetical protein